MTLQLFSWIAFAATIFALLIADLGLINKEDEVISYKKSIIISAFYFLVAILFGLFIWWTEGHEIAIEYYTGYLLEKTMSLDNIFMISLIFSYFNIPQKYQHRVLFWGILGVIVLRAMMIYIGAAILNKFAWMLFVIAIILIVTGVKALYIIDKPASNIKDMVIYKWLAGHLNLLPELSGNRFVIRKNQKLFFTPLFVSLVIIETTDLIFALDSIPAIFAITQNSFVVYTSNIFAILGLRALFFCLADIIKRFMYVKYSLAIILILIGLKIFVAHYIEISKLLTLGMTVGLILGGITISLVKNKKMKS